MKIRHRLIDEIAAQQKWIEKCDQNPKSSYYGKNAAAVRKADSDALRKLEKKLANY